MIKFYITLITEAGVIDLRYPILAKNEEDAIEQAAAIYPEVPKISVYTK
jgi:hypothetical protein